MYINS